MAREGRFTRYALDELFDSSLYSKLAEREKDESNRLLLEELASIEMTHCSFWCGLASSEVRLRLREKLKLRSLLALTALLGKTFTIKLLERRESCTIREYEQVAGEVEGAQLDELRRIIEEEKRHEAEFASRLNDIAVRQLGSIALGISDAIVELTGVLLGFASYTESPLQAAVAGIIVGVSAALSMTAAAYAQAKHETGRRPGVHAGFTGVFYMLTVLLLITPLVLGFPVAAAVPTSVALALALLALLSFYSSIVLEREFLREFAESASIVMAVAFAGYMIGVAARGVVGSLL